MSRRKLGTVRRLCVELLGAGQHHQASFRSRIAPARSWVEQRDRAALGIRVRDDRGEAHRGRKPMRRSISGTKDFPISSPARSLIHWPSRGRGREPGNDLPPAETVAAVSTARAMASIPTLARSAGDGRPSSLGLEILGGSPLLGRSMPWCSYDDHPRSS